MTSEKKSQLVLTTTGNRTSEVITEKYHYGAKRNKNSGNIILKSALGYWDNALENLFEITNASVGRNFKIVKQKWEIEFDKFDSKFCPEIGSNNKLNCIKSCPPNDWLYVYIAPVTWASRYKKFGFKILGPAFGTKTGLSIYANKGEYKKTQDSDINIGTIGQYITSTALLRVYHLFMTDIFKTNIHLISENDDNYPKTNSNFRFPSRPNPMDRLISLKSQEVESIDFAIFTDEDSYSLKLENEDVREILKIDPILIHIFNIEVIPRTVYCIHESQLNMYHSLTNLQELFTNAHSKYNKPIYSADTEAKYSDIYPIDPYDPKARDVQKRIIHRYRSIEVALELNKLEYTDLNSLLKKSIKE
jgi:hypothetical protein